MKKYNIGLDIGTTSVGWAVVECDKQKIMRKGNRQLWGVRLFEEASTAEVRRLFRSSRRRYDRRRERIKLLQEEFKEEINKLDPHFFDKLKESKYKDSDTKNKNFVLSDEEKSLFLSQYNGKFKTIYHLRNHLMNSNEKADIRLIYLALHHIIKYRGHFNYNNKDFKVENLNIKDGLINLFNSYFEYVNPDYLDVFQEAIDMEKLSNVLISNDKNDMKQEIKEIFNDSGLFDNSKVISEFQKMFVGYKFNVGSILSLDDIEKDQSISFSGNDLDDIEKLEKIEEICGNKIDIIYSMKDLYDALFLKRIFNGSESDSLSALMISKYDKYNQQLKYLKTKLKADKKIYKEFFKNENCVYQQYVDNKITIQEFCKKINDSFVEIGLNETVDFENFLPKITSTENGKYPFQLNKNELEEIINKQGKYYNFLLNKTNNGEFKIIKLLEFKIPYYVGPLKNNDKIKNENHFAWIVRKSNEKITPYNFDDIVDKEETAEKFILRMISKCTYLLKEYALPNNSILYSRFKVMNELKQIKINGYPITVENQHKILEELFMKEKGKISNKKFKDYLFNSNEYSMYTELNITGYSADDAFANNMQSYIDFFGENGIFNGTDYTEEDAENIIKWITIFDDKDMLLTKVKREYPLLSDRSLNDIKNKKYKGWGSLSEKLLTEKYYPKKDSGVKCSIIDLMYETKENFMQILNNKKYKFQNMIAELNDYVNSDNKTIKYELVGQLATSPANKKGIYQALLVLKEIINFIGYEPENVIIEMARSEDKKERKYDKKKYLEKLYDKCKNDINNYNELKKKLNESVIDSEKLYLYFIQEGKCLYSGKPIDIYNLNSGDYEVDHIIPRTLIKDNSIDNKALVCRQCNQDKAASYVLPQKYRTKENINWWKHLNKLGLISLKKYNNLIRNEFKDEQIEGFINRQLVETRQITKHVANIISELYKDTKVVYLKANLSHNYREKFKLYKFRDINDYHHAHDAYLAAVLGEYKEKYLKFDVNYEFIKEYNQMLRETKDYKKLSYGYVINSLDNDTFDIFSSLTQKYFDKETGELKFNVKEFNDNIENTLYRNDILISRKVEIRTGMMYKQTIKPAADGLVRLKKDMPTGLYGGYTNVETSYLCLINYKNKNKLIGIPCEVSLKSLSNNKIKDDYIRKTLNIKSDDQFNIIKDYIPYETEIIYKNHNVYIKGYSVSKKTCEISNAIQLHFSNFQQKQWKEELNFCLNVVDDERFLLNLENKSNFEENLNNILVDLYNKVKYYPLFESEINKIEKSINLNQFSIIDYKNIIKQLFIIYHCNSKNGNLKEYGLGDRIGRLSGNNITTGKIITKSVTGIWEHCYEF